MTNEAKSKTEGQRKAPFLKSRAGHLEAGRTTTRRHETSEAGARSRLRDTTPTTRHTMHPPGAGSGRVSPAPPGGRFWHGFAVRRPPLRRAGRGLSLGRFDALEIDPMQSPLSLDKGGMERKTSTPNFFTERSLAEYLAVSDRTIRNWIRRGQLPSYKLGSSRRIDPADVEDFLARHRDETA
jgi:excisionase family DNA binding protein